MAIDDQDIDQVLADLELELFEDDPDLVQSFGALWHPSLMSKPNPPVLSPMVRHQLAIVRVSAILLLALVVLPGVVLGEWAPLQAATALLVATAIVVGVMTTMMRVAARHSQPSAR